MLTNELVSRVVGPSEWLLNKVSYYLVPFYFVYTNLQSFIKLCRKLMV